MASVLKDVLFVSCDFFPLWFVVLLIDVFYCDTNTGNAILRELPGEGRFMRNNSKNSSSNTIGYNLYTIGVQVTATTAAATTATAATAATAAATTAAAATTVCTITTRVRATATTTSTASRF